MAKVEVGGVASALVVACLTTVVGLASVGLFTNQSEALQKRLVTVEIAQAKESVVYEEILRRLGRIETKLDSERK